MYFKKHKVLLLTFHIQREKKIIYIICNVERLNSVASLASSKNYNRSMWMTVKYLSFYKIFSGGMSVK